eukprot:6172601-Pleurochrysis_carterae.AAC.2
MCSKFSFLAPAPTLLLPLSPLTWHFPTSPPARSVVPFVLPVSKHDGRRRHGHDATTSAGSDLRSGPRHYTPCAALLKSVNS